MNPLISIIVPVYNAEKTLKRCIDSITNQIYINWELLLIDDGSKDNSGRICDEYSLKDNRIKVFRKENGGVSSARNLGLNNAKGKWITFCDSDDYVYPSWLCNFVECLSDNSDLICQSFNSSKSLVDTSSGETVNGFEFCGDKCIGLIKLYENKILGYLWVKLFKKEIIDSYNIRFNEDFNFWEDQVFCIDYFCYINTISCTNKIGYNYCVPDWDNKYKVKENIILVYESIYKSFSVIFKGKINNLVLDSIDGYVGQVLISYKNNNSLSRRKLKKMLDVLKHDFLKSHLFFLTKWIVYLDKTTFLGDYMLKLHVKIKKNI